MKPILSIAARRPIIRFLRETRATAAFDYGLAAAVIAVLIVAIGALFQNEITRVFSILSTTFTSMTIAE